MLEVGIVLLSIPIAAVILLVMWSLFYVFYWRGEQAERYSRPAQEWYQPSPGGIGFVALPDSLFAPVSPPRGYDSDSLKAFVEWRLRDSVAVEITEAEAASLTEGTAKEEGGLQPKPGRRFFLVRAVGVKSGEDMSEHTDYRDWGVAATPEGDTIKITKAPVLGNMGFTAQVGYREGMVVQVPERPRAVYHYTF